METIASENKLKNRPLELAIKKEQDATLEKYSKWAVENGMPSEEIQLLDAPQIVSFGTVLSARGFNRFWCTY